MYNEYTMLLLMRRIKYSLLPADVEWVLVQNDVVPVPQLKLEKIEYKPLDESDESCIKN